MHRDHVIELPSGFEILASTDKCAVQMMVKQGKYWCVQGHPEFSADFVQSLVDDRLAKGIFTKELVESLSDVRLPLDTSLFALSIHQFLGLET
jgi:hypothetical protein